MSDNIPEYETLHVTAEEEPLPEEWVQAHAGWVAHQTAQGRTPVEMVAGLWHTINRLRDELTRVHAAQEAKPAQRSHNGQLAHALRLTADETEGMTHPRDVDELLQTLKARHTLAVATAKFLGDSEGTP